MRLGGRDSDNFIDRTGQSGGRGGGGGMMSAGMLALIARFVFNKFGIVGVLILGLGYCALSGGMSGLMGGGAPTEADSATPEASTLSAANRALLTGTLESTDEVWGQLINGYQEPVLVAYRGGTQTACGYGQAVMGPFYCPGDERIYIDPSFFRELETKFGASGDFAARYVIAHEVGHHIQKLEGTLASVQRQQARLSEAQGNRLQVGVELQADCYAGVWAANARDAQGRSLLEPGDVEEGMTAASSIGDDTLQRRSGRAVQPESFTHGTSAQRMEALRRGLQTGDPRQCNYAG